LVIGFCSNHCEPAVLFAAIVRALGTLYVTAENAGIRALVLQLGLVVDGENPTLSFHALDVVTSFEQPPQVIEAAIRYLTKIDTVRSVLTTAQRCELAIRLLTGGAPNLVIVAAVPLLRPFATRIWEDERVRAFGGRARGLPERTLKLQLEFYAKERKNEFTADDLVRCAVIEPTRRRSDVSSVSVDSFERISVSDSPGLDGFEPLGEDLWAEPLDGFGGMIQMEIEMEEEIDEEEQSSETRDDT
jgi:hypothetical protein